MTQKKKLSQKLSQAQQAQKHKQQKRRKKEQKQLAQRLKKQKQQQAIADEKVKLIYQSGLADAYKCKFLNDKDFLSQAYKEDVKFNIFQYAAQKVLKFEKLRREKNKKISQLEKGLGKIEQITVEIEQKSKEKLRLQKSQKKLLKQQVSKEKKNKQRQSLSKQ